MVCEPESASTISGRLPFAARERQTRLPLDQRYRWYFCRKSPVSRFSPFRFASSGTFSRQSPFCASCSFVSRTVQILSRGERIPKLRATVELRVETFRKIDADEIWRFVILARSFVLSSRASHGFFRSRVFCTLGGSAVLRGGNGRFMLMSANGLKVASCSSVLPWSRLTCRVTLFVTGPGVGESTALPCSSLVALREYVIAICAILMSTFAYSAAHRTLARFSHVN